MGHGPVPREHRRVGVGRVTRVGVTPPWLARARVDGGLCGLACAAGDERVRKWVRLWSMTEA